jgi:hypothetical protein
MFREESCSSPIISYKSRPYYSMYLMLINHVESGNIIKQLMWGIERGDYCSYPKTFLGFCPPSSVTPLFRFAYSGFGALEVWQNTTPHWREGSLFLFSLYFSVLFGIVKQWLHPKVRIRSSTSYPRFGCASSTGGERVEWWIFWDLVSFLCFRASFFQSTIVIIGDGYYSSVLVL